jgi:hypothetical protein
MAEPANTNTAVWYSGEPTMCTLSSNDCNPNIVSIPPKPRPPASGSTPGSDRRTPFGRPVVPDV